MNKIDNLLKSFLGENGFEILKKGIYRQDSQSSIETIDTFLPLLVVPRTILSWLVQNIQPIPIGSSKKIPFPGDNSIYMDVLKLGRDSYRANFIKDGKIIHKLDKQTLPNFAGHLITVGEMYDEFLDEDKDSYLEAPKKILEMSNITDLFQSPQIDKMFSHQENMRNLINILGKLIDALVSNKIVSDEISTIIKDHKQLNKETISPTSDQGRMASSVRQSLGTPEQPNNAAPPTTQQPSFFDNIINRLKDFFYGGPTISSSVTSYARQKLGQNAKGEMEPIKNIELSTNTRNINKLYHDKKRRNEALRKLMRKKEIFRANLEVLLKNIERNR